MHVNEGRITGATSIHSDVFIGHLNGNVSGNCTTATTVTDAAQPNITSLSTRGLNQLTINSDLIMNKPYNLIIQNNTGSENINIGIGANMFDSIVPTSTQGIQNIGIGVGSLNSIEAGQKNIGIGYNALNKLSDSYSNTAVGTNSMSKNTIGNNNSAFGEESLNANIDGHFNTAIGYQSMKGNTSGNQNTCVGYQSGNNITSGSNNVCIGSNATVSHNEDNQIVIGSNAQTSAPNSIKLGDDTIQHFDCNVVLTVPSDKRIKKNIIDNDLGIDFITKLRTVKYNKVNPADYPEEIREKRFLGETPDEKPEENNNLYDGLIAQEVEEVLNNINKSWSGHYINENNGKQALDYDILTIPLIKAVQELKQKNDELKSNIIKFKESINLK